MPTLRTKIPGYPRYGALMAHSMLSAMYTYYVDSVNGSDSNNGKNPSAAFKTIGALPSLTAGQSVGLACGSTWREQLTISVNSITVASYGSGNLPVLDGADAIAAVGFSKTGGQTNVYQATVSVTTETTDSFIRAWENGTKLIRATSVANCDATAGSYFPSADANVSSITLYIHASDDSNPGANGKTYEYNRRLTGLFAQSCDHITMTGVVMKRGNYYDACAKFGKYATLTNCQFLDGTKHNVFVSEGSILTNCLASDALFNSTATLFVHNVDTATGVGVQYINCSAQMPTIANPVFYDGFFGHVNVGGNWGTVTYQNCTATNCRCAFYAYNCTTLNIVGCTTTNCKSFSNVNGETQNISNAVSTCTPGIGDLQTAHINVFADASILNITNSTFIVDQPQTSIIYVGFNNVTIAISNSTLTTTVAGAGLCTGYNKTGNVMTVNGSIIDTKGQQYFILDGGSITYVGDNNHFKSSLAIYWLGTSYSSIAAWRTASSQDAHSVVG